jgi:putative tricarboxylic transport membrane protein
LKTPAFAKLRDSHGLLPFALTGAPLEAFVQREADRLGALAREFGVPLP